MRVFGIVGPTAIGKTDIALGVAALTGAEIVSCDSRQIYRGLTIGTAKPTPEELARVRHHLVDVAEPDEAWSAGRWAEEARTVLHGLAARGIPALVVGGSGLYLRALREGLAALPSDPEVRRRLRSELETHGLDTLHERLRRLDPAAAERVHPRNRERLVRALEVITLTGRPLTELWRERRPESPFLFDVVVIDRQKAERDERIDRRVEAMFRARFLDEVRTLVAKGFAPTWPSYRTLGYPEAVECLEGKRSEAEAIVRIQQRTRRFAKRQLTWFRAEPRAEWVDASSAAPVELVRHLTQRLDASWVVLPSGH